MHELNIFLLIKIYGPIQIHICIYYWLVKGHSAPHILDHVSLNILCIGTTLTSWELQTHINPLYLQVDEELEIKGYYAGHVLGAAMFHIKVGAQSVVYTVSSHIFLSSGTAYVFQKVHNISICKEVMSFSSFCILTTCDRI